MKNTIFITVIIFIISCSAEYPKDLGNGYKIDYDGNSDMYILDSQNTVIIDSHILDFEFDSTFVLAVQRPWDSIPNIRTMKLKDANIAFENSTFKQYWILNKKAESLYSNDRVNKIAKYSNVYGPYTLEEYLKKKDSLNVPKDLKLKLELE